jgi:endonuclease/exonuclease/phosphatase (EEP) superfamily protein YafD
MANFINQKYITHSLSFILFLGLAICILPFDHFVFKVGSQYSVQIMLSYLALGLVFLMIKGYRLMYVSFVCCALLCLFLKYSTNSNIAPLKLATEETIDIAHFNVSASLDYEDMIKEILNSDADLVSLQEVTPDWEIVLKESLQERYPYSKTVVRFDPFGLAVYSKLPLNNLDTFVCANVPNIIGTVDIAKSNKEICFITSHALPPFYSSDYKRLRKHLHRIADFVKKSSCPVITIGNYNAVPWSYEIQDFRSVSHLNDSRRGFLPTSNGSFSIFQLPSDHIFHSDQLDCIRFEDLNDQNLGHIGIKGSYQFNPNYSSL